MLGSFSIFQRYSYEYSYLEQQLLPVPQSGQSRAASTPQPHHGHPHVCHSIVSDCTDRQRQRKLPIPCCLPSFRPHQSLSSCRETATSHPPRLSYSWDNRDRSTRQWRGELGQSPWREAHAATSQECSPYRIEAVVLARRGSGGQP